MEERKPALHFALNLLDVPAEVIVNLGGDADTIGALAGIVAGAA